METLPVHLCLKEVSLLLSHSKFTTIMTIYNYKENSFYCSMILVDDNILKFSSFILNSMEPSKKMTTNFLYVLTSHNCHYCVIIRASHRLESLR